MGVLISDWTMPMQMVPSRTLIRDGDHCPTMMFFGWHFLQGREYPIDPSMEPQISIGGVNPELARQGQDPSATPLWLPGQSIMNDNHLPVWWSK